MKYLFMTGLLFLFPFLVSAIVSRRLTWFATSSVFSVALLGHHINVQHETFAYFESFQKPDEYA